MDDRAHLKLLFARTAQVVFGALVVIYAIDLATYHVKLSHGTAIGTVHVTRVVVAALKGNKEEYYPDGSSDQPCTRSFLPESSDPPCWWLERHRMLFER